MWATCGATEGVAPHFIEARLLRLALPYSKTRAYLFLVGLGCLATLISSVLDHARTGFATPWLWIPTAVGVFGVTVAIGLGLMDDPEPVEIAIYGVTMLALIAVGLAGAWFHIQSKLTAEGTFVGERFLRGTPALAPLLFANIRMLGLIALLDPSEPGSDRAPGAQQAAGKLSSRLTPQEFPPFPLQVCPGQGVGQTQGEPLWGASRGSGEGGPTVTESSPATC